MLVKEALIEMCVVTSVVVGWLSRACTVAKRCIQEFNGTTFDPLG